MTHLRLGSSLIRRAWAVYISAAILATTINAAARGGQMGQHAPTAAAEKMECVDFNTRERLYAGAEYRVQLGSGFELRLSGDRSVGTSPFMPQTIPKSITSGLCRHPCAPRPIE